MRSIEPAKLRMTDLLLVSVLSLFALGQATAHKPLPPRDEVIVALGAGEKEGRIYFDSCEMSSNSASCPMSIDASDSQEPSQCAVSSLETAPQWLGILDVPAYVVWVSILNVDPIYRSLPDALMSVSVRINSYQCAQFKSNVSFAKRTFPCDRFGESVMIDSEVADKAVMTICEVEVVGLPLKFPTAGGESRYQKASNCKYGSALCNELLDNITDSSKCPETDDTSPFFLIKFDVPITFHEIHLYSDSLDDLTAFVNMRRCGSSSKRSSSDKRLLIVKCSYFGDVIHVYKMLHNGKTAKVQLCEVQAFGHGAAISIEKYRYLGCYRDVTNDRDLSELGSGFQMNPDRCVILCKRKGMKYFALQNGLLCFCGSSFGKHGKAEDEASCSKKCLVKSLEACGAELFNSVYEIV